jgi:ArsR family transcriptional regulator, arsenate/arsenite/antimonite-responsive transcriptional repressor
VKKSLVLDALSALAHENRLDLVRLLVGAGPQGMAQGDIARQLEISASRLAFHLSQLEQAGLVAARRESRNVFYAANTQGIGRVLGYVLNDCCRAHPEVTACCQHAQKSDA